MRERQFHITYSFTKTIAAHGIRLQRIHFSRFNKLHRQNKNRLQCFSCSFRSVAINSDKYFMNLHKHDCVVKNKERSAAHARDVLIYLGNDCAIRIVRAERPTRGRTKRFDLLGENQ